MIFSRKTKKEYHPHLAFKVTQVRIWGFQRAGVQTLVKRQTNIKRKETNISHISVITF